ncbi:MAG: aminotransferase class III-fold pyridoxal phosphate-dependent enzyme [Flavobacteriaceae bacterium]|nr:aminotransferase class III-fold pyridoxal phosphate-dependent enzyme [Flavobacteriaceae bacterium]
MANFDSKDLWEKDKNHFFHPYTDFRSFETTGSTIYTRGENHFIFDQKGNRYLDAIAGLWCVNIGHGNRQMADYIAKQTSKLAYYNTFGGASSPPAAELSYNLADLAPKSLNKTFFSTGGSLANDTAIKTVHYYFNLLGKSKKKKIITRYLGYHGSTYLTHALTGIESTHIGFDLPLKELIVRVSAPYPYRRPTNLTELEYCDQLIEELKTKIEEVGPEYIAAFIAEPIMGAGGIIVPPKNYLKRTREICKKYDILYIVDEVVTAFGRLGHMISCKELFGIEPDILVLAKGISSGYIPLGATMISDDIYQVINQPKETNPYFSHGFTYSGHALACAAGLKNIEILQQEKLPHRVQQLHPYFLNKVKELEKYPIVGEVRGSHFMIGIELVKDKTTKEAFDFNRYDVSHHIYLHCKRMGAIVRPIGPMIILSPPLTFDQKSIDELTDILSLAIEKVLNEI